MLHGRETMTGLACLASLEVATVTSDFSLHQPPAETRPTQDFELAPTLMKVPPHFERILPENQKKSFFSLGGRKPIFILDGARIIYTTALIRTFSSLSTCGKKI